MRKSGSSECEQLGRLLWLIVMVLGVAGQEEPTCERYRSNITLFNLPNESQWYDLSQYFRGYSLTYELVTEHPENYILDQPFKLTNTTVIPNSVQPSTTPFDLDETRVSLDILVDSNLAWQSQGASLIVRSPSRITVQMARLTTNMQLDFKEGLDIELPEMASCFDLSSLDVNITMVDCQYQV